MKSVIYAVIFSAAIMGAASAETQGVNGRNDTVQPVAGNYELATGEFDNYAKTFVLEDGRRITFTQSVANYYVQLQGEKRTTMLPQSPGVFMTPSGVRIQFRDDGDTVSVLDYDKLAIKTKAATGAMVMAKQ